MLNTEISQLPILVRGVWFFGLVLFLIPCLLLFHFLILPCFHMKANLCNSGSFFSSSLPQLVPCPKWPPGVLTLVLQTGLLCSPQTCCALPWEFCCCVNILLRDGIVLRLSQSLCWSFFRQREIGSKKKRYLKAASRLFLCITKSVHSAGFICCQNV